MGLREFTTLTISCAPHAILDSPRVPFPTWCRALSGGVTGWECTRPKGHKGRHEAGEWTDARTGGTSIAAVWDNSGPES